MTQYRQNCYNDSRLLQYAMKHPDAFRSMVHQAFEDLGHEEDSFYKKVREYLERAMAAENAGDDGGEPV